ncbi:hypothetical protein [Burkholderia anthina]|uniref:hypothetical protein n=1 Tax=Burkholderia anthina TaxID=179879 RepID=UPI00158952B4|nr:hypothetical protein [Burkholderia anthina]
MTKNDDEREQAAPDRPDVRTPHARCTMFGNDAGMNLLKRHAARAVARLATPRRVRFDTHAITTRCPDDAGQNLFRLSWRRWTARRLSASRPSIYLAKYIELSSSGKQLFGFLSPFFHRRRAAPVIHVNPTGIAGAQQKPRRYPA